MSEIRIRAKLLEMWSRVISIDKTSKTYRNGSDNMYPNELERAVMNSPTGSRSALIMSKYIAGQGTRGDNFLVNERKRLKINHLINKAARSYSIHGGFYHHVSYGIDKDTGLIVPKSYDILDYVRCRISKEDDNDYEGKIVVKDWEKEKNVFGRNDTNKAREYYPFDNDQQTLLAQINDYTKDGDIVDKIRNFCGQVLYVNSTPEFKYAVSKFDAVYNDLDTEYRMSLYSNTSTRGGFLGKLLVLTQGMDPEKADEVQNDVQKWLGAENASYLYVLDVEHADDLDDVIKIVQVESQYNDDQFVNLDKRVIRNISGAANNIPIEFIYSESGSLFGTGGDKYRELKEFYNEQTSTERELIEESFKVVGLDIEIIPITEADEGVIEPVIN